MEQGDYRTKRFCVTFKVKLKIWCYQRGWFEREVEQGLQKGSDSAGQATSNLYCLLMLDSAAEETIRGCDKKIQMCKEGSRNLGRIEGHMTADTV